MLDVAQQLNQLDEIILRTELEMDRCESQAQRDAVARQLERFEKRRNRVEKVYEAKMQRLASQNDTAMANIEWYGSGISLAKWILKARDEGSIKAETPTDALRQVLTCIKMSDRRPTPKPRTLIQELSDEAVRQGAAKRIPKT